jgi:diguanylate cyclase (GGDEF)-like protein
VDAQARLSAVLAAVRALGGNDDLAQVTRTLACAAASLTTFRDCTVYLYESHDGLFVPYACNQTEPTSDEAIPREAAESLMSHRHRLGYSYYAQTRREPGAWHEGWRAGDVLLVPLLMKNGDVMGFISLDRPADRQVPQADDLAPLETVAALGAGVIARLRHTDEVLRLATTDGLTGLLNRRALEERLHRELQATGRRRSVALMMIDLDDFSAINNHHGHQIGDEALRLVADVVRTHLRRNDAGGRYGGDEFVVILPDLDAAAAVDVAERVRTALVEATTHAAVAGRLPRIHTSIGVALFPDDAASPDALIKAADEALYLSKRLGKNCVSVRSAA